MNWTSDKQHRFNFFPFSNLWIAFLFLSSILSIYACQTDTNTPAKPSKKGKLFTLMPSDKTGVDFVNLIEETPTKHVGIFNAIYDGAGVAVGDINGDQLPDMYFTGNEVANKLYLNKGDFKFEDITSKAGVDGGKGWHNGPTMADVNGDGLLDIYVCKGGWIKNPEERRNLLFINLGDGNFKESAAAFGLDDPGYSFQGNFFDYDKDGDLDLYLINHPDSYFLKVDQILEGRKSAPRNSKDRLYRNDGNQKFTDVTEAAQINNNYGFGLSVTTADLNSDGFIDIYVANDYTEKDYCYLNQGNGTFKESIDDIAGHISMFSMGTDIMDINNDGLEDIFTTEMLPESYKRSKTSMASMNPDRFQELIDKGFHHQYMHNALQLNQGNGRFSEIAQLAGLMHTDWSWSCLFSDFDNDGLRDLFVANGYRRDVYDRDSQAKMKQLVNKPSNDPNSFREILDLMPANKLPNYVYQNQGGLHFANKTTPWGMNQSSYSHGAAVADFDLDGDLDLVVNNFENEAFVYKNNTETSGSNYLRIKLEGASANTFGLGAKVTIRYDGKQQYEEFKTVRGYLSTVEPILHFGLGDSKIIESVEVEWLNGKVSQLKEVKANQVLTIKQSEATQSAIAATDKTTYFREQTQLLKTPFKHQENDYDDYHSQILLPHRQSTHGPFVAVADVNGDGREDFYVGGAHQQAGVLYLQNNSGAFDGFKNPDFVKDKVHEDLGAHFFDADGDGDQDLYVVSGGAEFPELSPRYQDRLYLNDGQGNFKKSLLGLPKITASGSCVVSADFDGDDDLDLFVGGRTVPNRYPYAPQSFVLRNDGQGKFSNATAEVAGELSEIGMVTSAEWADFDQDGDEDLLLAGEWMGLTLFKNENGKLSNASEDFGLANTTGWWNKLEVTDFDADGDLDVVAGNLGLNYKFHGSLDKPFHVYCDDFDGNGSYDIVLAKYDGNFKVPVRGKQCSSEQMPFVGQDFPSYNEFADAKLEDIYGEKLEKSLHYQATFFESAYLENTGTGFKLNILPVEAQISTINGIISGDFDGDQKQDLLIAGNRYTTEAETTRADASIGLMLTGKSNSITAVPVSQSGFSVPYDVKDLQKININGKVGVLVASNDDLLRLYVQE